MNPQSDDPNIYRREVMYNNIIYRKGTIGRPEHTRFYSGSHTINTPNIYQGINNNGYVEVICFPSGHHKTNYTINPNGKLYLRL